MAKKIKKYKVGLDSETFAISLVESPAIESDFIALSKEEEEKQQVFLESNEKHLVIGPALIPEKDIYRNNGKQEFYINFSKESIEKMSQDFMKEHRQYEIKTDHDKVADEVCVVESWLVSDSYRDKSSVLGMTVPEGTWMVSLKVNNIETWDRIKAGELKGFSVESMIALEEFEKQNDNNMEINANEEMFFDKIKNVFKEVLASVSMSKAEEDIEPISIEDMAEQTPNEPTVETPAEPTPEPTEATVAVEEPAVEEPKEPEVVEEQPKVEEAPKEDTKHLEDLINSMKSEIEALKGLNAELKGKVKTLEKQPSAKPISTVGGKGAQSGVESSTYQAWREQMRAMY
jgi:outer membrane biosynthesis protein TonB